MSVHDIVPTFGSLKEIYADEAVAQEERVRWQALVDAFKVRYGQEPEQIVRAPGRVNVLGEHVDYSLFPVLPAAIRHDVLFAIRSKAGSGSPCITLGNIQSRFKPCTIPITKTSTGWDVDFTAGGWESYMQAVVKTLLAKFFADEEPCSVEIMVSGNVPPGSGLSSSAAFVVAAVLTVLVANGRSCTKDELVQLAIASEHRMGVQTGGMDQSASVLGQQSSLLHISFFPSLAVSPVPISPSLAIVISNSMAPHSLADSAPKQYNLRVVESLIAARLMMKAWGVDKASRVTLKEALSLRYETAPSYESLYAQVDEVLGANGRDTKGWTREEMIEASGMSAAEFSKMYLEFLKVRADHFHLYRRARHILRESERVERFCELSQTPSSSTEELGQLLVASHKSCQGDYDCTHEQTDLLQSICMRLGAIGSRQTGGGWGGAVISLVHVEQAAEFLAALKAEYAPYQKLDAAELDNNAFITRPGVGAGVFALGNGL